MTDITWTNERRKLKDLRPWERNPRQITKTQAQRLVESFDEFGQVETIAIGPNNEVYNGHQRLNVLMDKHGKDYELEVRVSSQALTEKQREKLTVYLHKGAAGEWDFDTLSEFDLDDLLDWGFDKGELDLGLWAEDAPEDVEPQIDKAEELRVKWGVESGQLWQLGEHRLVCGDCTDAGIIERLMQGEQAGVVVTDPPYNVAYSSLGSNTNNWGKIENDDMSDEDFYSWLLKVAKAIDSAIANGASIYLCHGDTDRKSIPFIDIFRDLDWKRSSTIIWAKQAASMGWQDYRSQHECLSYGWKQGAEHYFTKDRSQTTVWEIKRDAQASYKHPTQKPVELFEKAIGNSTQAQDLVYDPFLGSGTTLIACERLGRKCRAVEISPAYVAVAIQRWVDVTGKEPVLLGS